jgi:hypothetical protein
MAKYKVGDKVRVKANIKNDQRFRMDGDKSSGCRVNTEMEKKAGKVVTISYASESHYRVNGNNWYWTDGMFEGIAENHKIVITTDGKTTTARLFNGKELIKKAEAKCSPDDTFDFMTGAKLAMERLEEKPVQKFVPHLESNGEHYGNIGDKTNIKDAIGRKLRIGDTVELYNGVDYRGEKAIVVTDVQAFVMGICVSCRADGTIAGCWQIIKKRGYEEVANGENVGAIKYIKEEE